MVRPSPTWAARSPTTWVKNTADPVRKVPSAVANSSDWVASRRDRGVGGMSRRSQDPSRDMHVFDQGPPPDLIRFIGGLCAGYPSCEVTRCRPGTRATRFDVDLALGQRDSTSTWHSGNVIRRRPGTRTTSFDVDPALARRQQAQQGLDGRPDRRVKA